MWGFCPENKLTSWKIELYKRTMMLETRYQKTRLNQTWILPCLRPSSGECPHPRALPTIKHKVNRGGYFECGAPGAWVLVRAWADGNNMNVPVGEWHGDDVIGCDINMAHWWWWCGVNTCMMWHGDDMAQVKWHSCTTYMVSLSNRCPWGLGPMGPPLPVRQQMGTSHSHCTHGRSHMGTWCQPKGLWCQYGGESGGDGKSDAIVGDCNVIKHEHGCEFQLVHSRHRRYLTWSETCNLILANNLHWIILWNIIMT